MLRPLVILLFAAVAWPLSAQDTPEEQAAAKRLEEKGLIRQGTAWINATEEQVRTVLAAIPAARHAWYVSEYERWELMQARLGRELKEELAKVERDVVRFRGLKAEFDLAAEQAERFSKLARVSRRQTPKLLADPELYRKVRDTIKTRDKLAVLLLRLDELTDEVILKSYSPLLEDADVGLALRTFGPQARLGPLKRYDSARRELDRVNQDVFTDSVPMIPLDDRFAFWGLANDRVPVELTYSPENSLTLVPEDLIEKLAIPLDPEKTPRITVSVGERQQDVFLVRIPSLRIGKHVLKNIEAAVLPKKESAGRGQLGRDALRSFRVTLHTGRLQFELTSAFELEDAFLQPE